MKKFFESNPGLKSRFNYFITFEDYTVDQMFDIFLSYCKNEEYILHDSAKEKLKKYLELHSSNPENKNANGRFVRNVFDRIIMNQAIRLATLSFVTKACSVAFCTISFTTRATEVALSELIKNSSPTISKSIFLDLSILFLK